MCGRAAQTVAATLVAAATFGVSKGTETNDVPSAGQNSGTFASPTNSGKLDLTSRDNYNMSPGMDAAVIWMEKGELKMGRKVYVTLWTRSVPPAQVCGSHHCIIVL